MSDKNIIHLDTEKLVKDKISELVDFSTQNEDLKELWGKQFDLGLAWVQFPEGAGGLAINPKYQLLVIEEVRKAGISQKNRVANLVPTILRTGVWL